MAAEAAALGFEHAHKYFDFFSGPVPKEVGVVLAHAGGVVDDVGELDELGRQGSAGEAPRRHERAAGAVAFLRVGEPIDKLGPISRPNSWITSCMVASVSSTVSCR